MRAVTDLPSPTTPAGLASTESGGHDKNTVGPGHTYPNTRGLLMLDRVLYQVGLSD